MRKLTIKYTLDQVPNVMELCKSPDNMLLDQGLKVLVLFIMFRFHTELSTWLEVEKL